MSFTTAAAKINNNCSMAGWCRFLVVVVLAHIQTMIFKCPNVVHVLFVQCSSGSEQRKPQQEHVSNGQCAAHSIRHCPFSRMLIHSIYTFNERENIPVQGNNDNNEKGKEKQFYGYSKSIVHLLWMLLLLVENSIVFFRYWTSTTTCTILVNGTWHASTSFNLTSSMDQIDHNKQTNNFPVCSPAPTLSWPTIALG